MLPSQVRPERDGEKLAQGAEVSHLDSHGGADTAPGTVGADDVARVDVVSAAARPVGQLGVDAGGSDGEVRQLGREPDRPALLDEVVAEDRLEMVLRDARGDNRADRSRLLLGRIPERHRGLRRREEGMRDRERRLHLHAAGGGPLLETPAAQQLHGSGADAGGLGKR